MEERQEYKSIMGRRVILVVPIVFIVMVAMVMFMFVPMRYQFKVINGELGLWIARGGWLISQQSKAFGTVAVGNADLGSLLDRSFETEMEAVKALSSLVTAGIADREEKLITLEKQIVVLYTDLVAYLGVVKELNLAGKDDNVEVLQDWLNYYMAKLQRTSKVKRVTGSETFPYEMLGRPLEGATGKTVESKMK
jgi:hypothetical protein